MAKSKKETAELPVSELSVSEEKDSLFDFPSGEDIANVIPEMDSPEWSDYVLSQLAPNELADGAPKVDGLRRLAKKLLGPIVRSLGTVVQSPTFSSANGWQPAVSQYEVAILWTRDDELKGREVVYRDCAETWEGNCKNAVVAQFRVETATTRGEARCLRKLLALKVIAAEEKIYGSLEETPMIMSQQILFIDTHCRDLNINVIKFVNAGKHQFKYIQQVPYETAVIMGDELDNYVRDRKSIPPKVVGYDAGWRSTFSK